MTIHSMQEPLLARGTAGAAYAARPAHPARPDTADTPVPSPDQLRERRPASRRGAAVVDATRQAIADVLSGRDTERMVVVVGPCSIHDPDAALEYARRLSRVAKANERELIVVMRTYFEKPRSCSGWKGLINDPQLDGSCDVVRGLELAREILVAIGDLGLACASEVLDPLVAPYVEDLLSWVAIGARTVESQPHRELAGGLPMPVGVKNGLDGRLDAALNAVRAIAQPHRGLALSPNGDVSVRRTSGNLEAHLVLRGSDHGTNYGECDIEAAADRCRRPELRRPVWVDCSHGNSGKDHRLQAHACRAVLEQFRKGQNAIGGLLVESNLLPGNQPWRPGEPLERGISITDACIGWCETEWLLEEVADAVRFARTLPGKGAAAR